MFTPPFILSIAGGGSTYTPYCEKPDGASAGLPTGRNPPLRHRRGASEHDCPGGGKVIRDHSQSIKFTVTNDPEVAFSGAHFVFAQMRVGQYKMREQDEKIPLRHGVVGQETCGPGGLALRAAYDPANGRAYRSGGSLRA